MCGIVGLFLKDKSLEPELGMMLSDMLVTMTDRGPDSAGIAIYGNDEKSSGKITIQSDNPDENFKNLDKEISAQVEKTGNVAAATAVGKAIAERAVEKGISKIAFDRSGFLYHGRVKALAEAAREAGLQF